MDEGGHAQQVLGAGARDANAARARARGPGHAHCARPLGGRASDRHGGYRRGHPDFRISRDRAGEDQRYNRQDSRAPSLGHPAVGGDIRSAGRRCDHKTGRWPRQRLFHLQGWISSDQPTRGRRQQICNDQTDNWPSDARRGVAIAQGARCRPGEGERIGLGSPAAAARTARCRRRGLCGRDAVQ